MRKDWKQLALVLAVLTLLSTLPAGAVPQSKGGVPSSWAQAEVSAARTQGLIPSTLDKDYQKTITRQEFCQTAAQLLRIKTGLTLPQMIAQAGMENAPTFTDTKDQEILALSALGVVNGKSEGRFDPSGSITRQEAAVLLFRLEALFQRVSGNAPWKEFSDENQISDWARYEVGYISSLTGQTGAVMGGTGNNRFSPRGTYTREQAFLTMFRLSSYLGENNSLVNREILLQNLIQDYWYDFDDMDAHFNQHTYHRQGMQSDTYYVYDWDKNCRPINTDQMTYQLQGRRLDRIWEYDSSKDRFVNWYNDSLTGAGAYLLIHSKDDAQSVFDQFRNGEIEVFL